MHETYTPNAGPWVELPPPTSRNLDFKDRVGSLVYRLNPTHLAYWNPDVSGRGVLFGGLGYLAICWFLGYAWLLVPLIWTTDRPVGIPIALYLFTSVAVVLMGPLSAWGTWFAARKPLPPPTFFNRPLQQVMQYQKVPGRKGEWLVWDWASITAAIRETHIYSTAGRSTMYVLVLMQLEPGSNKILRSFGAYASEAQMQPAVAAWEYMRRYMNEPPEQVPAAYIPAFEFDPKTWAVRCQTESMQIGMNADGTFRSTFARFFMPLAGTFIYPFMWATLWIEKTAPKVPLPPDIAAQNHWDEAQPNPYKIEYAYTGPNAEFPVAEVYERIKARHWVMTVLGFGIYSALLLTMLAYGWMGSARG